MFVQDEGIEERKAQLRAEMRTLRSSLSPEERNRADSAICEQVCSLPQFKEAHTVFAYLAFGTEVETRGIMERAWSDAKSVVLPRCVAPRQMRWFRVTNLEGLERSRFGVDEPRIDEAAEVMPAECADGIALVPGLTFDAQGYRLGYGGGFYDAFLADFPGTSVGLCRSAQRSESLVGLGIIDTCDRPVNMVAFA